MKVHDYIIELKKPSYLVVDLISRLMLMIAIVIFGYAVFLVGSVNWYTVLMGILITGMVAWWVRCTIRQNKGEAIYYRFGLLLATIGWVIAWKAGGGPSWIPILYFIAVVSEKQVKFPQEIAFDEYGVTINSLPKKSFPWALVTNVVLKDNILTVDLKNNTLIQKEIESGASRQDEQEFNEFCRSKLSV